MSFPSGIGVNIFNPRPSVCLNDLIDQQKSNSSLSHFTIEEFVGQTVGYLQKWVSELSQSNIQATTAINNFYQLYTSHWMHQ